MLSTPAAFPHVGAHCFFDDVDRDNRPVIEPARILRDNGDGTVLISLTDRRYPREIASGNRTVLLADLRATEQPEREFVSPRKRRGRGPRR